MNTCKQCGTILEERQTKCPGCGAKQPGAKGKTRRRPWIILICVQLVILLGLGTYLALWTYSSNYTPSSVPSGMGDSIARWQWVEQPYLDYDTMVTPRSYTLSGNLYLQYLNVTKGSLGGTVNFEGNTVFALEENYEPIATCGDGHAHGGPRSLALLESENPEEYARQLKESGFLLKFGDAHGGSGDSRLIYHPVSQEYAVNISSDSPGISTSEEWFERLPAVAVYTVCPETMAADFSDFLDYEYPEGYTPKYGLIDSRSFEIILPNNYEISNLEYGYYRVFQADKYAYFSTARKELITDFIYEDPVADNLYNTLYSNGFFGGSYAPVLRNGLYGFINENGIEVIPPQFEGATHVLNGEAWVKQGGLWGKIALLA